AGIDPFELRLINCNQPGETTPMGLEITTCGLRECLEATAEKLDWKGKRGRGKGKRRNRRRGVGMASLIHVGGSGRIYRSDASGIILRLDDYGNVYVYSGGVEMGQGHHSALTLGVAESLGVKPENVFINQTDTATCPWDVGTHASRGAFTALNAAAMASAELRERIFTLAEDLFHCEVGKNLQKQRQKNPLFRPPDFDFQGESSRERFDLRDGRLYLKDGPDEPWARVGLGRFLRAVHFREGGEMLTAEAFYDPPSVLPDWQQGYGNMSACYAFGTQGAEV
ncbi:MAG: molybdopterin-dependent oxidoreductase, partial [bacterium]|nr:molybdopterin-dependent oxidoreductase [bacterium]